MMKLFKYLCILLIVFTLTNNKANAQMGNEDEQIQYFWNNIDDMIDDILANGVAHFDDGYTHIEFGSNGEITAYDHYTSQEILDDPSLVPDYIYDFADALQDHINFGGGNDIYEHWLNVGSDPVQVSQFLTQHFNQFGYSFTVYGQLIAVFDLQNPTTNGAPNFFIDPKDHSQIPIPAGAGATGNSGGSEPITPPSQNEYPDMPDEPLNPADPDWIEWYNDYLNNYMNGSKLTAKESSILSALREMEKEDNENKNKDCQGTARNGRLSFNGILEHVLIEYDYVDNHPGGLAEYQIPGGSVFGNKGYADIANPNTGEMFEIKSAGLSNIELGKVELAFYIARAITNCPNMPLWQPGFNYSTRILPWPKNPSKALRAQMSSGAPGIIVYDLVDRVSNPIPVPVAIPVGVLDRLKELLRRLGENPPDPELVIVRFLEKDTTLAKAIITAGVAIMVGTIIEDILTLGVGIADDIASFAIAIKIIRVARLSLK